MLYNCSLNPLGAILECPYGSSTLQDIQAGRRTEIDALNGAVLKLAAKYDLDVPYNRAVFNLVKFLEAKNL